MARREFIKTSEGIHLVGVAGYTVCGDALEGDPDQGLEAATPTLRRVVTCPRCIDVVETCRGVRIRHEPKLEGPR